MCQEAVEQTGVKKIKGKMVVDHLLKIVLMIIAVSANPVFYLIFTSGKNVILGRYQLICGDMRDILQSIHLRITD